MHATARQKPAKNLKIMPQNLLKAFAKWSWRESSSTLSLLQSVATKRTLTRVKPLQRKLVELEGVEPSSKQGNHTLSTCLFRTSFSCCDKTRTTHQQPYLLNFA